jgi:hypothetical protein
LRYFYRWKVNSYPCSSLHTQAKYVSSLYSLLSVCPSRRHHLFAYACNSTQYLDFRVSPVFPVPTSDLLWPLLCVYSCFITATVILYIMIRWERNRESTGVMDLSKMLLPWSMVGRGREGSRCGGHVTLRSIQKRPLDWLQFCTHSYSDKQSPSFSLFN